jgi:hypothetical protein
MDIYEDYILECDVMYSSRCPIFYPKMSVNFFYQTLSEIFTIITGITSTSYALYIYQG